MEIEKVNSLHPDFLATKKNLYDANNMRCSHVVVASESAEYGACTFQLNGYSLLFRVAKITPTKTGQFVTLWKRIEKGSIQPFDVSDPIDFFVVSVRKEDDFGQFVFPAPVLHEQGVLSTKGEGGKRAMRVYPPWDNVTSRQAQRTQAWQRNYFLELHHHKKTDNTRVNWLYALR